MDSDNVGPTRKVARKRNSSYLVDSSKTVSSAKKHKERRSEDKSPTDDSQHRKSQEDKTMMKESWFRNSFCREKEAMHPENKHQSCVVKGDTSQNDSGVLDTSDAVLADLDLDNVGHYSEQQTSTRTSNSCFETSSGKLPEESLRPSKSQTQSGSGSGVCQAPVVVSLPKGSHSNSQIFHELSDCGEEDLFAEDWEEETHGQLSQRVDEILSIFDKVDSSSRLKTVCKTSDALQTVRIGPDRLIQGQHGTRGAGISSSSPKQINSQLSKATNVEHWDSNIDTKIVENKGMSLKERLKQKMKRNSVVPSAIHHTVDELRETIVQRAQMEALAIQRQGTNVDIGPFYGLPSKVQGLLETQRGITKFYDWQDECLRLPAVMEGRNLIYSLPTSGGKTLVAEILILRELMCRERDAILILPYVSIVQEKVRNLSQFAVELDFLVEEYAGSKGRFPPIKRRRKRSLYIATLEKAHSLVNSLIETQQLESLGLAVVDELHMIGEGGSRGSTLEAALLKLLHCGGTQIIGMSATLNNIGDLQKFLHAEVYSSNFRPVKLTEYVKVEDSVFVVDDGARTVKDDGVLKHDRIIMFPYSNDLKQQDPDHLLGLVLEVIPNNSCLVFCPTKKNCENVAHMLAKFMIKYHRHLTSVRRTERKQLLQELYKDGNGQMCPVLEYTVHLGIAYHHSGLTTDERRLIEDAYSEGTLCLLTCTSTLAAGVNLPAQRVILRSPYVGSSFIGHSQYKQMTGRAGRAGIDESGESILICKKADAPKVRELLTRSQEPCHSSLMYDNGKGIRSMLLSSIGLKILKSADEILKFMKKTLLSVQSHQLEHDVESLTRESLHQLLQLKLVRPARKNSSQEGSQKTRTPDSQENPNRGKDQGESTVQKQDKLSQAGVQPVRRSSADEIRKTTDMGKEAVFQDSEDGIIEQIMSQLGDAGGGQGKDQSVAASSGSWTVSLEVSPLGRATFKGSIDIDYCSVLYNDLKKAEESLVLASYLHLLYLVTPYDMAKDLHIPWMVYFQQMSTLNAVELRVATLIGVPESFIAKKASGQNSRQKVNECVISRFYLTLMLYELWQQKSVWQVAQRFQTGRGFVQNLLTSAASFASCVFHFCQELDEFWAFQDLLGNFVKRLSYCVSMELIPLMEIPGVKLGRARHLYQIGLRSVQDVAGSDPEKLVKTMEHMPRKAARQIVASAKVMLNEKAEALWEEVENLVGLPTIQLQSP